LKKKLQLQSQIKSLIKKYIKLLNLEQWEIDIVLSKSDLLKVKRGRVNKVKADYYAEVIYEYMSKNATLILTKLQTVDKLYELEDTIVHELLHIKFAPIIQVADSLITTSGLKKERIEALAGEIDSREHEIIKTVLKIILDKKEK